VVLTSLLLLLLLLVLVWLRLLVGIGVRALAASASSCTPSTCAAAAMLCSAAAVAAMFSWLLKELLVCNAAFVRPEGLVFGLGLEKWQYLWDPEKPTSAATTATIGCDFGKLGTELRSVDVAATCCCAT
jgi:hypothetical protein